MRLAGADGFVSLTHLPSSIEKPSRHAKGGCFARQAFSFHHRDAPAFCLLPVPGRFVNEPFEFEFGYPRLKRTGLTRE
jgi:hypothetical protein